MHWPIETGPHPFRGRLSTSHRAHTPNLQSSILHVDAFPSRFTPLLFSFPIHLFLLFPPLSRSREKTKPSTLISICFSLEWSYSKQEKMELNGNKDSSTPSPSAGKRKGGDKKDLFHVIHKVPAGDSPYVRAKHLQVLFISEFHAIYHFYIP